MATRTRPTRRNQPTPKQAAFMDRLAAEAAELGVTLADPTGMHPSAWIDHAVYANRAARRERDRAAAQAKIAEVVDLDSADLVGQLDRLYVDDGAWGEVQKAVIHTADGVEVVFTFPAKLSLRAAREALDAEAPVTFRLVGGGRKVSAGGKVYVSRPKIHTELPTDKRVVEAVQAWKGAHTTTVVAEHTVTCCGHSADYHDHNGTGGCRADVRIMSDVWVGCPCRGYAETTLPDEATVDSHAPATPELLAWFDGLTPQLRAGYLAAWRITRR